ncbi:MAG: TetR family transcriptional regulator, partial [Campylobacteraceae bacterium]
MEKSPKDRIFETALKLFSERDLSDVSIREIAKEANVNIASINYYFSSKEELYISIIKSIKAFAEARFSEYVSDYENAKKSFTCKDKQEQREFYAFWLKKIIALVINMVFGRLKENNFVHKIVVKEHMSGGKGFDILYPDFLEKIFSLLDEMIFELSADKNMKKVKIRTHTILGQIIAFVVTYSSAKLRLNLDE